MKKTERSAKQNFELIRSKILSELDDAKLDHINSYAPTPKYSSRFDNGEPSILVENPITKVKVMYDIEVIEDLSPVTLQKWLKHSIECDQLFIVVNFAIKEKVEAICADQLNNYEILTYDIVTRGRNTSAEIR
ncbi:MAG TPA: hypothetical protein VK508_12665 [Cyclobacteriaceae bacterium]|nr:hypothetical protein [Cyclobacteriaceae bacterium]